MQAKTSVLHSLSEIVGLRIYSGKSKVLRIGAYSNEQVTVDGKVLENVMLPW